MHTLGELREFCNGRWQHTQHEELQIQHLVTDSRAIPDPASSLFIALASPRRDGHLFLRQAYDAGIRAFLVSQEVDLTRFPDAGIITVPDTLKALQQIAAAHRKQFDMPVIGITGSNGKTIIKEWLHQLLHARLNVVRNPKSFNSQIGVPLSVWLLEKEHQIAIFEAGISQPGEMENLERIIRPTIGVFTNIGEAHSEGFMNQRQKINEKLVLFRHASQLVYCSDHTELRECIVPYVRQLRGNDAESPITLFSWSMKGDADLRVLGATQENGYTTLTGIYQDQELSIRVPFTDAASIENAIHCWSVLLLMGYADEQTLREFERLQPVAMRLELRHGINGSTLINDTYNSDLTSFSIALDYLMQQTQHQQHTVILSDMAQMALPGGQLYEKVAELVHTKKVQRFIGIGPELYKHRQVFRKHRRLRSIFFKTTKDFLEQFHLLTFGQEAILLKGARAFEFEKISILLEEEIHQTVLSINLSALTHNIGVYRSKLGKDQKLMAMVKAFSYGAGSYEIAQALQHSGVDYLTVAYADEGVALRRAGIRLPIMVMSPDAIAFDRMIAWKLEPELFNFRTLEQFIHMARHLGVTEYPVHIKLDTGMHRLGFETADIPLLLQRLQESPELKVASIFSHLAASEDPALDFFTQEQGRRFDALSRPVLEALAYRPLLHLCNTAGIARHPNLRYDMVRLGLGLYGIDGSGVYQKELQPVGVLRCTIAQIKNVASGETIGYSRAGVADTDKRIATITIGYADGYPRALGHGKAHVLINGQPAPTVGVICMDMCMVDVTGIAAAEGDSVLVFGPELPMSEVAAWADTIPYELMTGISQRVKRVYVNE